jgi:hypothetical protein
MLDLAISFLGFDAFVAVGFALTTLLICRINFR